MSLEKLEKLSQYTEKEAKLLLSRLGLDYRPLLYLFDEKDSVYTKLQNFDFVVNLLLLLLNGKIDLYLIYKDIDLEDLHKKVLYTEKEAKLLLFDFNLDYRPLLHLFVKEDTTYTKLLNFDFVVKLFLLSNKNVDSHLIYKKENSLLC